MATEKDTKQREIKFRAKGTGGKWWYGEDNPTTVLRHVSLATFFMNLAAGALDPKTLGQYIDRKDTNSKDIYEGDIVTGNPYTPDGKIWGQSGCIDPLVIEIPDCFYTEEGCSFDAKRSLIIGNIHDNPEILEKS